VDILGSSSPVAVVGEFTRLLAFFLCRSFFPQGDIQKIYSRLDY